MGKFRIYILLRSLLRLRREHTIFSGLLPLPEALKGLLHNICIRHIGLLLNICKSKDEVFSRNFIFIDSILDDVTNHSKLLVRALTSVKGKKVLVSIMANKIFLDDSVCFFSESKNFIDRTVRIGNSCRMVCVFCHATVNKGIYKVDVIVFNQGAQTLVDSVKVDV